jgi:4-hydroxybenzoate polyprenyltransferase
MAVAATTTRSLTALAKLGRVSNLPTVWTNVLAATVLAGGDWQAARTGIVLVAMSLFYVGGMYLNDYFDRAIDARERPTRPIPAGDVAAGTVAAIGFALLASGIAVMAPLGGAALTAGLVLALAIVGYDVWHKGNPAGPVVMGLCRALVYAGAAAAVGGGASWIVVAAALAMLAYVAGITYAAQQESYDRIGNLWPLVALAAPAVMALAIARDGTLAIAAVAFLAAWTAAAVHLLIRRPVAGAVSRAVSWLIAGIALVDAAFLAGAGAVMAAALAILGGAATLVAQRYVAGT